MQVHLTQPNRMRHIIAALDGGNRLDIRLIRDRSQRADRGANCVPKVWRIHRLGDVERTEVARNILAHMRIGEIHVVGGRLRHLQNLRAQVRHRDAPLDRVGAIDRVLKDDVRIAGLELDLRQRLEERARVDLRLADPLVVNHLVVLLSHRDVGERHAVDALDVVGREQVHVLVVLGQLEGDVRDDDAEREGLDADLFVSVFALGVEEAHDVGMVGVQIGGTGALARTQLVGIRERVLQQLHHRVHARRLILDLLDQGTQFAQVRQVHDAATPLGELKGGVDSAGNGLHVVFHAQEETGDELATGHLAGVEEGGVAGWKRPVMISSMRSIAICSSPWARKRRPCRRGLQNAQDSECRRRSSACRRCST